MKTEYRGHVKCMRSLQLRCFIRCYNDNLGAQYKYLSIIHTLLLTTGCGNESIVRYQYLTKYIK